MAGSGWTQSGNPATDALHVTERFRRKDFGHMEIQITIDDPKAYTKLGQPRSGTLVAGHGLIGVHLQREQR